MSRYRKELLRSRALDDAQKTAPKIDTEHRDFPTCPKCGAVGSLVHAPRDGMKSERRCPMCRARYTVTVHVTVTYSTEKV